MSDYRDQLIEFYKATLEEARHHDTINMQIFIALGIVTSLFLAAIGFLFARDFPLHHVCWAKAGILVLFLAVEVYFYSAFYRIDRKFRACRNVGENIERELKKKDEDKKEISDSLLVGVELSKLVYNTWWAKHRFKFYIAAGIAALLALFVFLFVFIKPCYLMIAH